MSDIPLELQRKFERRWAARFVSPVTSTTPKSCLTSLRCPDRTTASPSANSGDFPVKLSPAGSLIPDPDRARAAPRG
jgi:hypothetical protein